ncbi:MAG: hypothetical protein PHP54_02300 [Clostridia bacterium]|nr:hypothetical protein [Clostridia bacterium]
MEHKKEKAKDIIILIMLLIIVALVVYLILTSVSKKSDFVSDTLNTQEAISFYIGKISSDTFNAYDKNQIITGYNNNEEIKNIDGSSLASIADKDSKIEVDGDIYYKISVDKLKENLKIDLSKYSNLDWYIKNGEVLRVKFSEQPDWWNYSMDSLKMPTY